MNPRPPRGTSPKGPQPLISFRISEEAKSMISEIRALEPHAEPGLIPTSVGSDSEFARWLLLDSMVKLHNRLIAQLKLKDLIIKDKALHEQQDYILALFNKKRISDQDRIDAMEELQEKLDNNYKDIERLCKENIIPPPAGYSWDESPNPFEFRLYKVDKNSREFRHDMELSFWLFRPESRRNFSTKRKASIYKLAKAQGWDLDSVEGEKKVLNDLLEDANPMAERLSICEFGNENGRQRFKKLIEDRLRELGKE